MNKRYDITLELRDNTVKQTTILYTPGDAETMPLYIQLTIDGAPFEPPSGALATLNFVADDIRWPRDATILDDGTLLYEVKPEDIATPGGTVAVSVTVDAEPKRLTWQGFTFYVAYNLADGQTEPPKPLDPWVTQITGQVSGVKMTAFASVGRDGSDLVFANVDGGEVGRVEDVGGGGGGVGPSGKDGEDGADGLSAYELAVQEGFVGTLEEWLASLHGEDGQPGPPGVDGYTPVKGVDYFDGEPGSPGAAATLEIAPDIVLLEPDEPARVESLGTPTAAKYRIGFPRARDGKDGNTPYIGENGNWWIGDVDTGIAAQGPTGTGAGALPWCSGYFKDRSLAANTNGYLTPVVSQGDASLVSGNEFIAPESGTYSMTWGGGHVSIVPSICMYAFIVKLSTPNDYYAAITPITTTVISVVAAILRLEQGERISAAIKSNNTAQSSIESLGTKNLFHFIQLTRETP